MSVLRTENARDVTGAQARPLMRRGTSITDRRLASERAKIRLRGRWHTKRDSLPRSRIPMRAEGERDDAVSRLVDIDLVGHDDTNSSGEFCFPSP